MWRVPSHVIEAYFGHKSWVLLFPSLPPTQTSIFHGFGFGGYRSPALAPRPMRDVWKPGGVTELLLTALVFILSSSFACPVFTAYFSTGSSITNNDSSPSASPQGPQLKYSRLRKRNFQVGSFEPDSDMQVVCLGKILDTYPSYRNRDTNETWTSLSMNEFTH